jgi:hypothetical protein
MAWRKRRRELMARYTDDDLAMAVTIAQLAKIEEEEEPRWGGSVVGRRTVPRDRFSGYRMLYADYFANELVYGDDVFRRRFVFLHPLHV